MISKIVFILPVIYFSISWYFPWDELTFWDSTISITYLYDLFFSLIVFFAFKSFSTIKITNGIIVRLIATAIISSLCVTIAKLSSLSAPFKYVDNLFIQILILAPIIEEIVFRYALFVPFQKVFKGKRNLYLFNGVLFSASHASALFILPEEFFGFIYFQIGYTFILGWLCAKARDESKSMIEPILLHFIFNLIFYIGVVKFGL